MKTSNEMKGSKKSMVGRTLKKVGAIGVLGAAGFMLYKAGEDHGTKTSAGYVRKVLNHNSELKTSFKNTWDEVYK